MLGTSRLNSIAAIKKQSRADLHEGVRRLALGGELHRDLRKADGVKLLRRTSKRCSSSRADLRSKLTIPESLCVFGEDLKDRAPNRSHNRWPVLPSLSALRR